MEQRDVQIQYAVIKSWKYQLNAELEGEKYEWGKFRRRGSIFRARSTTRNVFIHGWNYKRTL